MGGYIIAVGLRRVFVFMGTIGASDSRCASHLDFDLSRLARWRTASAWGSRVPACEPSHIKQRRMGV